MEAEISAGIGELVGIFLSLTVVIVVVFGLLWGMLSGWFFYEQYRIVEKNGEYCVWQIVLVETVPGHGCHKWVRRKTYVSGQEALVWIRENRKYWDSSCTVEYLPGGVVHRMLRVPHAT